MLINNTPNHFIWTIREAKARLSEILRKADKEPQYIGSKTPYVIVTKEQWEQATRPQEPMGKWLLDNCPQIGKFELPDRREPEGEVPFI